jgi:hypothetical protein
MRRELNLRILASVLLLPALACADTTLTVSLDTSSLVGHPAGPFYFTLALTDGSGVNDANNIIKINNVSFGGGSSLGNPILLGGVSGSLASGITITDNSNLSWFFEQFAPGDQLTFSVSFTDNGDAGGIPDGLTFFIEDSSGVRLPTKSPAGDSFFGVDLTATLPMVEVYGSDSSRPPSVGNPVSIPAPTIPIESITIDIKPGDNPPTINLRGSGTTPVAVLSNATFDATNAVDRTSLRFGETGNEQSLASCDAGGTDINGDGLLDLVCHFTTLLTGFQGGDTAGFLTGKTLDGALFQGKDSVKIVGN